MMQLDKTNITRLAVAALLLITGGVIYVLFRSSGLILFDWIDSLGLSHQVQRIRDASTNLTPGSFIRYSLPDGLWLISYLLIINAVFGHNDRWLWLGFTLLLPTFAICHEVLQGLGICRGTFDTLDLLCYSVPLAIDLVICRRRIPSRRGRQATAKTDTQK